MVYIKKGHEMTNKRNIIDNVLLAAKGISMGAADVVPGVSGGTMAFILGIYEELLDAIRTIASPETVRMLLKLEFKRAYDTLPWRFLLVLGLGIGSAILTLASPIKWMLENHPPLIWAFFLGLVIASIATVIGRVKKWNAAAFIAAILGGGGAYLLVGLVPAQTPDAPWFLVISGAIAICAMILPGISGSFILHLMGKYEYVLGAAHNAKAAAKAMDFAALTHNAMIVFWVAVGAVIGIISFVRILKWMFNHYHDLTVALLIGFMIGSLRKIWPWKQIIESKIVEGKTIVIREANIMPQSYDFQFWLAVALALAGFTIVIIIEHLANRKERQAGA